MQVGTVFPFKACMLDWTVQRERTTVVRLRLPIVFSDIMGRGL